LKVRDVPNAISLINASYKNERIPFIITSTKFISFNLNNFKIKKKVAPSKKMKFSRNYLNLCEKIISNLI